jgi:hypothetical protein
MLVHLFAACLRSLRSRSCSQPPLFTWTSWSSLHSNALFAERRSCHDNMPRMQARPISRHGFAFDLADEYFMCRFFERRMTAHSCVIASSIISLQRQHHKSVGYLCVALHEKWRAWRRCVSSLATKASRTYEIGSVERAIRDVANSIPHLYDVRDEIGATYC